MTHEEILSMLGDYVDYLIANSSAEAPMWNIEKVPAEPCPPGFLCRAVLGRTPTV